MQKNSPDHCFLTVKVKPNAKQNQILVFDGQVLNLAVTAQPQDGKANEAVIALLSKILDIPKRDIELVRGTSSKQKVFLIKQARAWYQWVNNQS